MKNFSLKKYLLIGFIALSIAIIGMLFLYSEDVDGYRSAKLSDALNDTVREEIGRQNRQSTALAIALSDNDNLKRLLMNQEREKAVEVVTAILSSFNGCGHNEGKFWIQLHTPDLKVFIRSWDIQVHGMALEGFRKGLLYVRKTQKPFASIELGKKLNFKAIVPIKYEGKYVGSLEVIKNFDGVIENFAAKDISFLVLMDRKFLTIADQMSDYPRLDNFVVAHQKFDHKLFNELDYEGLSPFLVHQKSFSSHYFVAVQIMRDINGELLGYFVAAISKETAKNMMKNSAGFPFLSQASQEEKLTQQMGEKMKTAEELYDRNETKWGEIR